MTAVRRTGLRFESLADAVADAERLLAGGYERAGRWALARCCGHLTNWLVYPMDGFPPLPVWMRPGGWVLRNTVGRRLLERMLAGGRMTWLPTIPDSVPAADGDDRTAVDELRRAVERWQGYDGPLAVEPFIGPMTRAEWDGVHRLHCARHLGFLLPK